MIPLWLTITCSIISLIVICYSLITSDIDWKYTMQMFTAIAIAVITVISVAVVFISIAQRLSWWAWHSCGCIHVGNLKRLDDGRCSNYDYIYSLYDYYNYLFKVMIKKWNCCSICSDEFVPFDIKEE